MADNNKTLVAYFQSWSEKWSDDPKKLQLANIAPYVNMVIVSFLKPDATYEGGNKLSGTGLDFSVDGVVVKDAIAYLKSKNPNTKVLVAVGGATYQNFAALNTKAIADVVKDFGFDGVDIDYEPFNNGQCSSTNGQVTCTTDDEYRRIVNEIRQALPRPYLVTVAAWSVGAYGEGQWTDAKPKAALTGLLLNLLRSPEAGYIDQLNVMSYDASPEYDPKVALTAYQNYFKGNIVMGVEVPPEGWGGHVYTIPEVRNLAQAVVDSNAAGMMLWSLQKQPEGTPTDTSPNAQIMAQAICQTLSLGNCEQPLFQL
ncbi:MAG: glycoside hydrolase family 18 protein [Nostoc sp.]|uniref:glycoside hydrolase family 18 protein n=1 Tax=Nostoc sp. TaxID=1180 RepID=UPI002FF4A8C6